MVFGFGRTTKVGAQCCTALALFHRRGRIATFFDGLGEVALILGIEEGDFTDFVEIEADCVRHGGGTVSSVWGVYGGNRYISSSAGFVLGVNRYFLKFLNTYVYWVSWILITHGGVLGVAKLHGRGRSRSF